jgi:hypothetical protein
VADTGDGNNKSRKFRRAFPKLETKIEDFEGFVG